MFGIGGLELFLILLFGFLLFGPDKLPALAQTVGKAIAKFRSAQEEMSGTLKGEFFDKEADEPFKNPLDAIDTATQKAQKVQADAKEGVQKAKAQAESFSERKARYDRERAAKKAAEAADTATASEEGSAAAAAAGAVASDAAASEATTAKAESKAPKATGDTAQKEAASAPHAESFAERKARYEKERAARKAEAAQTAEDTKPADAGAASTSSAAQVEEGE